MHDLIKILERENASLVVRDSEGNVHIYRDRGVSDLYRLLTREPHILSQAAIADKVVGRGAAALMILGGVKRLHANILSQKALDFLNESTILLSYTTLVVNIINRNGDDICPVEKLTTPCKTPQEALQLITTFLKG